MTAAPSAKTGYTVLGGAVVTILVWIVTAFSGVEVPAEVAAAAATLVAGAIALLVPAKSGTNVDYAPDPDAAYEIEGEAPEGDIVEGDPVKGV
jgi:predicted phage tail protein